MDSLPQNEEKTVTAVFGVDYPDKPRLVTAGKPFAGARLLMAIPEMPELKPVMVNGADLIGVGYTRRQALEDLRGDCRILPPTLPHGTDRRILVNLRRGALAAVDAALAACKSDPPETSFEKASHAFAEALYAPERKGKETP